MGDFCGSDCISVSMMHLRARGFAPVTPPVRSSLHVVEQFWDDGGVRLARWWPEGEVAPVLVVIPVQEHPPASIIQRLEQIQQSFAFDKRISILEAEKPRSA